MRIEIYLSDGEVAETRVETQKHKSEERIMMNVSGTLMEQIEDTGFVCIPESGGYRVINGDEIKEIRIIGDEKEMSIIADEE